MVVLFTLGWAIYSDTEQACIIHPSSVKSHKSNAPDGEASQQKQLYAFGAKRRNDTSGSFPTTCLVTTTRIDPLTYILFGVYNVEVVNAA